MYVCMHSTTPVNYYTVGAIKRHQRTLFCRTQSGLKQFWRLSAYEIADHLHTFKSRKIKYCLPGALQKLSIFSVVALSYSHFSYFSFYIKRCINYQILW